MDDVFKALADPTRRSLLDELFKQDGQTLSALEERLPMTRFGVMKHLKLLEEAGLVVDPAARAREAALPQCRPDPARPRPLGEQIHRALGRRAERSQTRIGGQTMEKIFEIYIKTTPERLWQAITDTEMRRKYNFGAVVTSDWTPGSRYQGVGGEATIFEGRESGGRSAAPTRPELPRAMGRGRESEGTSRVTWEIEPIGDSCLLKGHPRSTARGRQQSALRRLADGPLRTQDAAGDRRDSDHARLAALAAGARRRAGRRLIAVGSMRSRAFHAASHPRKRGSC